MDAHCGAEFVRSGTKATGVRDDGGRFGGRATEGESVEKREKRERRKQVEEERKRKDKRTRIEHGAGAGAGEKAAEAIGGALPPPGGLVPFAPTPMGWDVSQDLQEARCTMQRIRKLNYSQFSEEGVITELPFPALERAPVGRPGRVIKYVGRRQVYPRALQMVLSRVVKYDRIVEQYRGVIITGPSGSGKSCLLRALTCQLIATLPKTVKIICFWYFDAFGEMEVQDALLFAYCEECEVEPGLAERILKIDSVESLKTFLQHRKSKWEMLYLVTDGEEQLDRVTERIDSQARKWLYAIYAYADFELKALSPKAEAAALSASSQRRLLHRLELNELFLKEERSTFLKDTVLGRLLLNWEKRWCDVDFYAGMHPLSLCNLLMCCKDHVRGLQLEGEEDLEDWVHLVDKDVWLTVLDKFRCGEPFSFIRASGGADKSFRLGERFCSDYIYTVYEDAAAKNLQARKYRFAKLTGYVNAMLRKGVEFYNWSALGWACESFVGDAILAVGITISGMDLIKPATVEILHGGQPVKLDLTKLNPGESKHWSPAINSFKYVDGIILRRIGAGASHHMILLQVTVNPESHRGTEVKFMKRRNVEKWCALYKVSLHYVYICPKMPGSMKRMDEVRAGDEVIKGEKAEVGYFVHVEEMRNCLPRMSDEEYELLERLAGAREEAVKKRVADKKRREYWALVQQLPTHGRELHKKKRRELEKRLAEKGIRHTGKAEFPTKLDIVRALIE